MNESGWERLTEPQKYFYSVLNYDGQVNNGGHLQYFVNSTGNLSSDALAGLQAIGANQRSSILSDALKVFGPNGPLPDEDERHQQLAVFSRSQNAQLDVLNSRYYTCGENIDVLLSSYALENKEHFSQGR